MKLGSPVLLAAKVTCDADSYSAIFDTGKLAAPHREPLAIQEIRFYVGYPPGASVVTAIPPGLGRGTQQHCSLGYEVRVTMRVGQFGIAEDVPIWGFAPSCDAAQENLDDISSVYRWRLVRPMYLPPGTSFNVQVRRTLVPGVLSSWSTSPVPVWCSILGHVVTADEPRTMNVPYAATFAPTPVAPGGGPNPAPFLSTQQDLLNKTKSAIEFKYAIGRLALIYPTTCAAPGPLAETWDVQDGGIDIRVPSKLTFPGGGSAVEIVGKSTEFNSAFDFARRWLRLGDLVIQPGDRLTFQCGYPTGVPAEWTAPQTYYWAPNVTIVGQRAEVVP